MTDSSPVTIASLPFAGPLTGTEAVPIDQGGATKRTTTGDIVTELLVAAVDNTSVKEDAGVDATKLAISFDYTTPPAVLTISNELKNGYARPEWAYKSTDGSNWQPAIQTISDALADASPQGGIIDLGYGSRNIDGTIEVTGVGTNLIGRGGGDFVTPATSAVLPAPTTLVGVATTGDVLRIKTYGCSARGMQITADTVRAAVPFTIGVGGLRCEATDTGIGTERVASSYVEDVRAIQQPGDGILICGDCVGTTLMRSEGGGNKGHGICISGGERTSRTNLARPGIIDLYMCRSQRNGGHAIAIGDPTTVGASLPYRVRAYNFENFYNADDPAVRYFNSAIWAFGEEIEFHENGISGESADGTFEAHEGIYIAGRGLRLMNNRYISVSTAVVVGNRTDVASTQDAKIDGMYFSNPGGTIMNPAVNVTAGADQVYVRAAPSTFYTSLASVQNGVTIEQSQDIQILGSRFRIRNGSTTTFDVNTLSNAIGFYNAIPVAKQTVTGSKGSNAALASLLSALADLGLITDSTS